MVILMAGVIFPEPDVDVDADAEVMLIWEIRLLCALLKKVNDKWQTTNNDNKVSAISAAKTDVDADADSDADADADADAAAELSNTIQ